MLIAVAGLSGAGKTTAVEHLQAQGVGQVVYVGEYIRAEVRDRGLTLTPENEHLVRRALREELGRDAFAQKAIADIKEWNQAGAILLDAIYVKEEGELYRRALGPSVIVIGIEASFEVRAPRLARRGTRSLKVDQLRKRDQFELDNLRLGEVVAAADHLLVNEGSLAAFKKELDTLAVHW